MTLMASETETYRWPPVSEPEVIVGRQREATPIGRRKLNISRSSGMGNPFVLKEHGGDCETAEEAINSNLEQAYTLLADTAPGLAMRLVELGVDPKVKAYAQISATS